MKILTLEDEFTFGKHKGETVAEVCDDDPGYILWASKNIDWIEFDKGIVEACEAAALQDRVEE